MSNEHDGINLDKFSNEEGDYQQATSSNEGSGYPAPPQSPPQSSSQTAAHPQNPYEQQPPVYGMNQGAQHQQYVGQTQYPGPAQYSGQQAPSHYPQGVPYHGGYMQVQEPGNGFGVASLVMGIVALVGAWIPFLNIFSILLGIGAVIFGILGMKKSHLPKGTSIAGLITGGAAFLISSFIMFIIIVGLANAPSPDYGYDYDYNRSISNVSHSQIVGA